MCSVSLGPEGCIVTRPRPINTAGKLRSIASKARQIDHAAASISLEKHLIHKLEVAANAGQEHLDLPFDSLNINEEQANVLVKFLTREGFETYIDKSFKGIEGNSWLFITWNT
jgi:hypothetical protein